MTATALVLSQNPAPALPFAPGAARELLRSRPEFLALLGDDPSLITTRELPDPLTRPVVTIQAAVNRRENITTSRMRLMISVWVPLMQVFVDDGTTQRQVDPEELAWDIAAMAGQILDMRRYMGMGPSFTYRGASWRGQWDEGPATLVDTDRGPESPIFRAVIQVVMQIGKPINT
ncbi:MAG: hypothetical protein QM662_13825 [Gordonia sp. (in: high G+C Gram-positive bacteria)]